MKTEEDDLISVDDFAEIIGVTPRTVRNLISAGIITKAGRGKISLRQAVRALLAKEKASPDRAREGAARAGILEAKLRVTKLELAEAERAVIKMDEARDVLFEIAGACRFEMQTLAARSSNDPTTRAAIAAEVSKSFDRISTKLTKRAAMLERASGGFDHE